MRRLEGYAWPGNVRELAAVLERAILVAKTPVLEIDEESLDDRLSVGSYRLISPLGSGGMGEVWLAKHRLLARPAAVKLIRQETAPGAAREQLVRRFQREAQVTARLRSPHTVQLYDFGVNDSGAFYYVMELLQGLDLQNIVNRFGPLRAGTSDHAPPPGVSIARRGARTRPRAPRHQAREPLRRPAGHRVRLLESARLRDREGATRPGGLDLAEATLLTSPNLVQGTPAFMAPELVFGEQPIDGRTDLYSLACAAYWALTGQLVFKANTPAQMLLHHAQTQPVLPSAVSELPIPGDLEALLMQCLEKDPAKRPASALALDARLARIRSSDPWTHGPGARMVGRSRS